MYKRQSKNQQDIESKAIFGQYNVKLSDVANLTLGLRYTDETRDFTTLLRLEDEVIFGPNGFPVLDNVKQSIQSDAFSYRIALDYQVTPDVLTYGSISKGYKSGGFNGGFLSLVAEEANVQVQPFDPEYLTAYEVGFKSDLWNNNLRINAAVFYNDFSDLQVFTLVPTGNLPVSVLDNASDAEVIGLEFDATLLIAKGLKLALSGSYMDSKLKDFKASNSEQDFTGNELAYTPKMSLTAMLRYEYYIQSGAMLSFQSSCLLYTSPSPRD